jgi:hypothetical protein
MDCYLNPLEGAGSNAIIVLDGVVEASEDRREFLRLASDFVRREY